jgi:hypothetical protein
MGFRAVLIPFAGVAITFCLLLCLETACQEGSPRSHSATEKTTEARHRQVSGRVFRADSKEPVAGLTVSAMREDYEPDGGRRLYAYAYSVTDQQGVFRFEDLYGPYFFRTGGLAPDDVPCNKTENPCEKRKPFYRDTYFPKDALSKTSKPVDVTAGSNIHDVELPVIEERTYSIHGRVEGKATGVVAEWVHDGQRVSKKTGLIAGGTFTIGDLLPGEYIIQAFAIHERKPIPKVVRGYTRVTINDADVAAKVRLGEAGRLKGTARIEGTSNLSLRNLEIGLRSPSSGGALASGIDPSGRFEITDLSPGEQYFEVFNLNDYRDKSIYVKRAECSGKDYASTPLILDVGTHVENCSIVIAQDKVTIRGRVSGGAGVEPWNVVVIPPTLGMRQRGELVRQSITETNGSFEIDSVIPGDYLIYAIKCHFMSRTYFASDFLHRYAANVKQIHVGPNGTDGIVLEAVMQD